MDLREPIPCVKVTQSLEVPVGHAEPVSNFADSLATVHRASVLGVRQVECFTYPRGIARLFAQVNHTSHSRPKYVSHHRYLCTLLGTVVLIDADGIDPDQA